MKIFLEQALWITVTYVHIYVCVDEANTGSSKIEKIYKSYNKPDQND